jgi:hypothetical protein
VPATRPDIVVLIPVPLEVAPPGDLVSVHEPVEGSPLITTLPVAIEQVGWVIIPMMGTVGVDGCAFIIILAEATDIHPEAFVTV